MVNYTFDRVIERNMCSNSNMCSTELFTILLQRQTLVKSEVEKKCDCFKSRYRSLFDLKDQKRKVKPNIFFTFQKIVLTRLIKK